MSFDASITALVAAVSLLLGIIVLRSDYKNPSNRLFFGFNLSAAIWISSSLLASYSDISHVRPYIGIGFGATSLLVYYFLMFCITFPKGTSQYKRWWIILLILPLIFIIFSFFGLVAVATPTRGSSFQISPGIFYYPYGIFVLGYIALSISRLIANYRTSKGATKDQLFYILLGSSIYAFLAIVFSLVMPVITHSDSIYRWGIYSVIVFLVFTTYAIISKGFLNIRYILTEVAVTIIIFGLLVLVLNSETLNRGLINGFILIVVSYGGFLVIGSIKKEIKQKEELELLAKKLEEANIHLKELDKLKDDFLSMASHELNTPLAAIEGYLSMILDEGMGGGNDLNPQTREYLNRIYKSSERLSDIVKDLLNVSRIESGRIHLIYAEMQIEDIIKQAVNEIDPKMQEKKHTICMELPSELLPKSWMDSTRITEVALNLLGNAVKYTDDGGHIEIGAKEEKGHLRVWVKDNGRGIPKDKADKVFQKFTQVDVLKDEVKGTGLGMYISQKFVELHKGKIWFESDGEGKGTTFFFEIPIHKNKPYDPYEGEGAVLR